MYKATIENHGDSQHHATTRHSSFLMDTKGQGSNPVDAFLASLCACLGHYVRDFLDENKIRSNGFAIDALAGVTPDTNRLTEIQVAIDLRDAHLDQVHRAALLVALEQCKIHHILAQIPGIKLTLSAQE